MLRRSLVLRAGHSKWANIKHKKAVVDRKRQQANSKMAALIAGAVRSGRSDDPGENLALRVALGRAKQINMPADNIARAIRSGLGSDLEEATPALFEGAMGTAALVRLRCRAAVQSQTRVLTAACAICVRRVAHRSSSIVSQRLATALCKSCDTRSTSTTHLLEALVSRLLVSFF